MGIVLTSQIRAVPSSDPVTTRVPSGLKATDRRPPECPLSVAIVRPETKSQSRVVWSQDAVTTRLPSGLKAAELTVSRAL